MRIATAVLVTAFAIAVPPALAGEPAGNNPGELREEIRERKRETREDERELRRLEQRKRARRGPGPLTVSLGANLSHFDKAEENCAGEQASVTFGSRLFLRAQVAELSYENEDDHGSCDGLFAGDSDADEESLLAGLMLGRSGFFVAAGVSAVDVEQPGEGTGPSGEDTGARYELGWNSRFASGAPAGFEILMFKNENDLRDFHGVAIAVAFGPTR